MAKQIQLKDKDGLVYPITLEKIDTNIEYVTGELFNGKKVYRQRKQLSALPNSGRTDYPHNISGITQVIKMEGQYSSPNIAASYPINYAVPTGGSSDNAESIATNMNATVISVKTGNDRSNLTINFVDIYYLKD